MQRFASLVCVLAVVAGLASCADSDEESPDLEGLSYVSECDAPVTIMFESPTQAKIQANFCEGYAPETWDYQQDGLDLTLAPVGQLGNDEFSQELFRVSEDRETLTLISDFSLFTCGNCTAGDEWKRQ